MRKATVCLSVCPSVKRANFDKTEAKSVQIFIPYKRLSSLVFREKEWLMGRPFLPEILNQTDRVESALCVSNEFKIIIVGCP